MAHALGSMVAVGAVAAALALGSAAAGPVTGQVTGTVTGPVTGPVLGTAAAPASRAAYALPLAGDPAVLRRFDPPAGPWAPGHRGVDLAGPAGAAVLAPADGTVTFAGTVVDRGVVTIAHPDGLRSSLEPVEPSVSAGARVVAGEQVGTLQAVAGHCAPTTCLHWGVRRGDAYVDPLTLVGGGGIVVLLPDR